MEFFSQYKIIYCLNFLINFWQNFWIEWFLLHIFLMYNIYRIWLEQNILKLIILLIYFLILICVYLSLLQLELFACFLFVSEFIIFVFFYTIFLSIELKINYSKLSFLFFLKKNISIWFLIIIFVFLFRQLNIVLVFNINDLYINFYNIFKIYNNESFNDLIFFFHIFYQYNMSLYFLIGVILLITTFFLLAIVMIYHYLQYFTEYVYFCNTISDTILKTNNDDYKNHSKNVGFSSKTSSLLYPTYLKRKKQKESKF